MEDLQAVLDDGTPRETEVRDLDGRCFFMRILPFRAEDEIKGVVLSLIDISGLDEARERISQLSAIVESSDDAIISKALDGTILSWNAGAERLYGYSAAEAIGQDISLIIPPEYLDQARSWSESLRRGEVLAPMEVERVTKDGHRIQVFLTVSAIKSPSGDVIGASAIAHDITELKAVRRAKEDSDRRIRLLLESTAEAIYGLDNDGNCTFANPACVHTLGYGSADELLGKNMHALIHHTREDGAPLASQECPIHHGLQAGQPVHVEEDLLWRRDGSNFYAEIWSHPMIVDGAAVGAVVTYVDSTSRKQAVDQLREEVHRREQFLAMLSHELRNPLSAIRVATRVLSSPSVSEEADRDSRRVIERQTSHINRLLDDLLDVSRMTQNKITLNKSLIDLRATVEDAVQSVQSLAVEDEIEIEVALPNEPLWVEGDAVRLQQIQANLLTNAIKYSPGGERVRLEMMRQDDHASIRVLDNGDGIEADLLEHIFEMFVQADVTLDHSHGGMGVGLTLVQKLVDLHGGSVSARSEGRGQGSVFEVRLPLARKRSPPPPRNPPKILRRSRRSTSS